MPGTGISTADWLAFDGDGPRPVGCYDAKVTIEGYGDGLSSELRWAPTTKSTPGGSAAAMSSDGQIAYARIRLGAIAGLDLHCVAIRLGSTWRPQRLELGPLSFDPSAHLDVEVQRQLERALTEADIG